MRRHVVAQAPLEACGLLAGSKDTVEAILLVHNAEKSPVRFRMDAQEQYDSFQQIEADGLKLIGIFHSHPTGPETVSATDIAESAYEVVNIIWSRSGRKWKARGFWIEGGQVTEVELKIVDDQ